MKNNKILIVGIFAAVVVVCLAVIISRNSISPGEFFSSLKELGPRVMSIIALPFIAVLFVLGVYLRKKNEERKWKKALLKTRAKKNSHN
jgi:hypothetical protein